MNLKNAYTKAVTYDNYVSTLGDNQVLHELHYNKFELPKDLSQENYLNKQYKILVITEPWCGDSLALLPIVRKLYESAKNWQFNILLRDENPEIMDQFLTNGARAIPIFLFLNQNFDLILRWGPRPKAAQQIYEDHRQQIRRGDIKKEDVIRQIRTFYSKDRGVTTINELHQNLIIEK
jgi:thiol-disulfide isomerase/thioredoxin